MNAPLKPKAPKKHQVCRQLGHGVVGVVYSDKSLDDATKICQSLNDETGSHIPQYFTRIQRRK